MMFPFWPKWATQKWLGLQALGLGIGLGLGLLAFQLLLLWGYGVLHPSHPSPEVLPQAKWLVLLAPLWEEALFRGLLLPVAVGRLGQGWGLLLVSLCFAALHPVGLGQVWAFMAGGALGAFALQHGSWGPAFVAHLIVNVVGLLSW